METSQFMERYRSLSRDFQNELQQATKKLEELQKSNTIDPISVGVVKKSMENIQDAWHSFNGWVLISTLDDLNEAKENCAPGLINFRSKLLRLQRINRRTLNHKSIRSSDPFTAGRSDDLSITTYIPYFEQLLDLLFQNAVKYSPVGGSIEIEVSTLASGARLEMSSIGPTLAKIELSRLGEKGFRGEHALKTGTMGSGFGVYNALRLAQLLNAQLSFSANSTPSYHTGGIPYSPFSVSIVFPFDVA
jgi:signal transduction histidine kinase